MTRVEKQQTLLAFVASLTIHSLRNITDTTDTLSQRHYCVARKLGRQ